MQQSMFGFEEYKLQLISDIAREVKLDNSIFDWGMYLQHYGEHLDGSLLTGQTTIFSSYLSWSKSIGLHHSITELMDDTITKKMLEISDRYLPPGKLPRFIQFIDRCRKEANVPSSDQVSLLSNKAPLGNLAVTYFRTLINGDLQTAGQLIMNAADEGVSVRELYMHVFQPGLRELGRLWELNRISVGQEHYFSAGTQLILSRLYPLFFNSTRLGKHMIATAVGGELHEIGVRMVADFFEMEGWDTWYMGANCPDSEIIKELKRQQPELLAVSVTMASHIEKARILIQRIHEHPELQNLKILVGGRAYLDYGDLFQDIGADGLAIDAMDAVHKGSHLVNLPAIKSNNRDENESNSP